MFERMITRECVAGLRILRNLAKSLTFMCRSDEDSEKFGDVAQSALPFKKPILFRSVLIFWDGFFLRADYREGPREKSRDNTSFHAPSRATHAERPRSQAADALPVWPVRVGQRPIHAPAPPLGTAHRRRRSAASPNVLTRDTPEGDRQPQV